MGMIDKEALLKELCEDDPANMEDYYYNAIKNFPEVATISVNDVKKMLNEIKTRFYNHFEEIMPSIMTDEIDEIFSKYVPVVEAGSNKTKNKG